MDVSSEKEATSFNLLFDLDGTLTDSREGITRCAQYAMERLGIAVPTNEELLWMIGPPIQDSMLKLCAGDAELASRALVLYRERYSAVGLFENTIFPGIREMLASLHEGGHKLYLATSKPIVYARRITEHFGLTSFFVAEHGCELTGGHSRKSELIEMILSRYAMDRSRSVMIGDRRHDIIGAEENRITSIGVVYGYGSREELEDAGATWLCDSPEQVCRLIWSIQ